MNGRARSWTYVYDATGRLTEARLDGRLICLCDYDREGRRIRDCLPVAMRRGDGAVFSLHYDQVGSLRVVADRSGNVIKEILYDPFGGIIEDTNTTLRVPTGFAGGLHDRDLGFVRFGWRDYDVNTGRWTAPDPLGERGGDPDWYGYCLDDPVNANDPEGLFLGWTLKQGIRQTAKAGIKKAGKEAAEKSDNGFLKGLDRFLNGKGLDKDPKGSDSDGDGIPDYYDDDSDWNENPEQLKKEREEYHRRKNEQLNSSNHNYGK